MTKFHILSSTVEDKGGATSIESHPALVSQVNAFVAEPKHTIAGITWLQSSGLKNGSWLCQTLTAVIEYNDTPAAADPFSTASTTTVKK